MLEEITAIKDGLQTEGYICDESTATVLYLADNLGKPILVEGPAGVGKTSIAQAFARQKQVPLIRLQCYEGIDEARAIYEWNYKKQLLHIQMLASREIQTAELEKQVFSEEFLLKRPLLQAVASQQKCCLLIDEIDKVDFEFEAMLLELMSEFQITLPELGTIKAIHIPYIFLTSNATRELSEALKRRCLFLYLDYPHPAIEMQVLQLKVPELSYRLAEQMTAALQQIRSYGLRKPPSIAEGIDWAVALAALGIDTLTPKTINDTLNMILKSQEDIVKTRAKLKDL